MKKLLILIAFCINLNAISLQKEYYTLVEKLNKEKSYEVITNKLSNIYNKAKLYKDENEFNHNLYTSLQIVLDEFFPRYLNDNYIKNDCYMYVSSLKSSLNPKYEEKDSFYEIYDSLMIITLRACLFRKNN